jgi:hypothetical protein
MKRFMGDPCDEILRNHSKGSRMRFYTLWADFCLSQPAAMGSSLPIMVTKRAGQIECKRVVNWSAVFQLVFQLKIKLDINVINQQFTKRIQITPASSITCLSSTSRKSVNQHNA